MTKLQKLAQIEGYETTIALLEANITDSVAPGICTNDDCDYTVGVEPDQSEGWCENCESNTVQSCMILAGII